eukprot:g1491.t1
MDDEEDFYDEFGNYIGPEEVEEEEEEEEEEVINEESQKTTAMEAGNSGADRVPVMPVTTSMDEEGLPNGASENEALVTEAKGRALQGLGNASYANAIVLHEDKEYYPSASEVYGQETETMVQDEDAQPIEEPIIKPIKHKVLSAATDTSPPPTKYDTEFLTSFFNCPGLTRNVALIGSLQSGKTTFVDQLIKATFKVVEENPKYHGKKDSTSMKNQTSDEATAQEKKEYLRARNAYLKYNAIEKYTDVRIDEQDRQMSVKTTPVSLVLPKVSSGGKNYLINLLDCPGHMNFAGENAAALRLADGVAITVCALEGLTMATERAIGLACRYVSGSGMKICLVITKMDRLIVELRLPPNDAYLKLVGIINDVNACIAKHYQSMVITRDGQSTSKESHSRRRHNNNNRQHQQRSASRTTKSTVPIPTVSPTKGNVCFSSAVHGWCFSLESFTHVYMENLGIGRSKRHPRNRKTSNKLESLPKSSYANAFQKALWGNFYYDNLKRRFTKHLSDFRGNENSSDDIPRRQPPPRAFVQFILEPLYKIYSHVLGDSPSELDRFLQTSPSLVPYFRGKAKALTPSQLDMNVKPLLHLVCSRFLGCASPFAEMISNHIDDPVTAAPLRTRDEYCVHNTLPFPAATITTTTNNASSSNNRPTQTDHFIATASENPVVTSLAECNPSGPLMVHITKLFSSPDPSAREFFAFGRVLSGTVTKGQRLRVLGDNFSPADPEDSTIATVSHLYVLQANRYKIEVESMPAGNWIAITGIDATIQKGATLTDIGLVTDRKHARFERAHLIRPLTIDLSLPFVNQALLKLAVEPLNPSELPKMVKALRCVSKSYCVAKTKVEESGEHVLLGTGELGLDCMMHDLRKLYSDIEVKVADPVVVFCETAIDTSSIMCTAQTSNKQNTLTMMCEPLEQKLSRAIATNEVTSRHVEQQFGGSDVSSENNVASKNWLSDYLRREHNWDILAAKSVWAFGPSDAPACFMDETLEDECDKDILMQPMTRNSIVQGFNWSCREGPLCDEVIRDVSFKLLDVTLATDMIHRGGGQIIPAARRACYSSFLTATPKLMEPVLAIEIECNVDTIEAVYKVLERRRGRVIGDDPRPGTPLYTVHGHVPAIDAFGLETDLRVHTQGQAFCQQVFDHWQVVPGDPLDENIELLPLERSPPHALAREFLVKTRRRKGLSENVSVHKYFDEHMLKQLSEMDTT